MNQEQKDLRDFHVFFSLTHKDTPTVPSEKDLRLRANLINEEAKEFDEACALLTKDPSEENMTNAAKELADLLYVVYGAGVTFGIDLEPVFAEVHRSNLTKVWPDGTIHRREEDGKIIKPPTYSKADVASVLAIQRLNKVVKHAKAAGKIEVLDAKNR